MKLFELFDRRHIRVFLGETFGTFLLLFLSCSSSQVLVEEGGSWNNVDAVSFGIATIVAGIMLLKMSGSHFNPAITIASAISGLTRPTFIHTYLLGQLVGSFFGYGLFYLLNPMYKIVKSFELHLKNYTDYNCVLNWPEEGKFHEFFFVELIMTFIMCFAWCSLWYDKKVIRHKSSTVVRFGFCYLTLLTCSNGIVTCSLNPIRKLMPDLFTLNFDYHWFIHFATVLGAVAAGVLYEYVFKN